MLHCIILITLITVFSKRSDVKALCCFAEVVNRTVDEIATYGVGMTVKLVTYELLHVCI